MRGLIDVNMVEKAVDKDHAFDLLRETIGRTRATIAVSHQSIERSDDRVRDTLHMLMRRRDRFDGDGMALSDEQLAAALEIWQATVEQHQIEREMQRTRAIAEEHAGHERGSDERGDEEQAGIAPPSPPRDAS